MTVTPTFANNFQNVRFQNPQQPQQFAPAPPPQQQQPPSQQFGGQQQQQQQFGAPQQPQQQQPPPQQPFTAFNLQPQPQQPPQRPVFTAFNQQQFTNPQQEEPQQQVSVPKQLFRSQAYRIYTVGELKDSTKRHFME